MITVTLLVADMHCSSCALKIEALEDEVPGIRRLSASYQRGKIVVEFDENQVNIEAITAAVRGKGYTVQSG